VKASATRAKSGPGPSVGLRASEPGPYKSYGLMELESEEGGVKPPLHSGAEIGGALRRTQGEPFDQAQGGPFDESQREQNCYNRARLAGGGRSEVICPDRNRLRRSGRRYP
jgi:hypothetical protein